MLLQIRYVLTSYLLIRMNSSIDALHHIIILQLKHKLFSCHLRTYQCYAPQIVVHIEY